MTTCQCFFVTTVLEQILAFFCIMACSSSWICFKVYQCEKLYTGWPPTLKSHKSRNLKWWEKWQKWEN